MKNELKPYDEYKNADLLWLDEIPKHWEIKRAKELFEKVSRPVCEHDDVITCFRDGMVTLRKKRRTTGFTEAIQEHGYQGIRKGDLVIHVMDAFAGAIGVSDSDGKSTPVYSVCVAKVNLNSYYFAHVIRKWAKNGFIQSLYRGVRERSSDFRFTVFGAQYIIVPPITEQNQIVRYLDSKLVKINKLMKAKKKQIELLKEKLMVITNNSFDNAETELFRMDAVANIKGKKVARVNEELYTQIGMRNRGRGIFHKPPIKGCELGESDYYHVEKDSVIFSGQFAWEGAVSIAAKTEVNCIASHRYHMVSCNKVILLPEYLWAFFMTSLGENLINQFSRGAAGRNKPLNIKYLMKQKIPVPTMEMQKKIKKYVLHLSRVEQMAARYDAYLREYQSKIISDVVLGKIDVRGIQIEDDTEEELENELNDDFELDENETDDFLESEA
ncbi:MAG: restriction endonuclease subunit S [Acetobacterium sp.]